MGTYKRSSYKTERHVPRNSDRKSSDKRESPPRSIASSEYRFTNPTKTLELKAELNNVNELSSEYFKKYIPLTIKNSTANKNEAIAVKYVTSPNNNDLPNSSLKYVHSSDYTLLSSKTPENIYTEFSQNTAKTKTPRRLLILDRKIDQTPQLKTDSSQKRLSSKTPQTKITEKKKQTLANKIRNISNGYKHK